MISNKEYKVKSEKLLVGFRDVGNADRKDGSHHQKPCIGMIRFIHSSAKLYVKDNKQQQSDDSAPIQLLQNLIMAVLEIVRKGI